MVENAIPPTPRFPDHGYIIKRVDLDKILLDYAREQCIDIATDLMSGLPAHLARPGPTPAALPRPPVAARSVPSVSGPRPVERISSNGGASGGQHEG